MAANKCMNWCFTYLWIFCNKFCYISVFLKVLINNCVAFAILVLVYTSIAGARGFHQRHVKNSYTKWYLLLDSQYIKQCLKGVWENTAQPGVAVGWHHVTWPPADCYFVNQLVKSPTQRIIVVQSRVQIHIPTFSCTDM